MPPSVSVPSTLLALVFALCGVTALAQARTECPAGAPESAEISWPAPCKEGDWFFDPEAGCRIRDWHPERGEGATWTGACRDGRKEGQGVAQWFERGVPIDRFEGTYAGGLRQGFGRYQWTKLDRFEGEYVDNVPHGAGTAIIAGESYAGTWTNGCFQQRSKVIAIGVPRRSCATPEVAAGRAGGERQPAPDQQRRGSGE